MVCLWLIYLLWFVCCGGVCVLVCFLGLLLVVCFGWGFVWIGGCGCCYVVVMVLVLFDLSSFDCMIIARLL